MYARKISHIADSRRHLRRDCGSLTYRRPRKKPRKASANREITYSRRRPLFLILLFFVAQYYFLQSPLFQFREVEVEGTQRVSVTDIETRLGIGETSSYWDLSTQALQANLASLHRLENAEVSVSFPGRVQVQVQEREPSFFVAFIGNTGNWYTVDDEGVVLESASPNSRRLRILLTHPVREGSKVRQKDLQVVRFFQDHLSKEMQEYVRGIKIADNGDVALRVKYGDDSIWVRLGRAEKLQYKLFLLHELMNQLAAQKEKIVSIDLRYSAPVVRKATPEVAPPI